MKITFVLAVAIATLSIDMVRTTRATEARVESAAQFDVAGYIAAGMSRAEAEHEALSYWWSVAEKHPEMFR